MSQGLINVDKVLVPAAIAADTHAHLRSAGKAWLEGMALWAGTIEGSVCSVGELIVPRQQGHRTEHGLAVTVDGDELHRINVHLYKTKQRLIAQIHSHPTHAYHSDTDDRYAIATTQGAFSIVVPDFAEGAFEIANFATYRLLPGWWFFDRAARWRKVPPSKAAAIFTF